MAHEYEISAYDGTEAYSSTLASHSNGHRVFERIPQRESKKATQNLTNKLNEWMATHPPKSLIGAHVQLISVNYGTRLIVGFKPVQTSKGLKWSLR
jgi:hypothetical protein